MEQRLMDYSEMDRSSLAMTSHALLADEQKQHAPWGKHQDRWQPSCLRVYFPCL